MSHYESCPGCWSWLVWSVWSVLVVCLSVCLSVCLLWSGSVKRGPGLEGCALTLGGCVDINEVWSERGLDKYD